MLTPSQWSPESAPAVGTTLATGIGPYGIAVDDVAVYWTDRGGAFDLDGGWKACAGTGSLHKLLKSGGPDLTLASGLNCAGGVTVDATAIYWTELGTQPNTTTDGTVKKLAK